MPQGMGEGGVRPGGSARIVRHAREPPPPPRLRLCPSAFGKRDFVAVVLAASGPRAMGQFRTRVEGGGAWSMTLRPCGTAPPSVRPSVRPSVAPSLPPPPPLPQKKNTAFVHGVPPRRFRRTFFRFATPSHPPSHCGRVPVAPRCPRSPFLSQSHLLPLPSARAQGALMS